MRKLMQGICLAVLLVFEGSCLESPVWEQGMKRTDGGLVRPDSPVPGPAPAVPTEPRAPPQDSVTPPASRSDSPTQGSSSPIAAPEPSMSPRASDEEERLRQLVERADRFLDLLEAGALDEAREEIDLLPGAFPGWATAQAVKEILHRRLERAVAAAAVPPPPAAENRESTVGVIGEARALAEAGREADAMERLEAARAMDPENQEVSGALTDLLKKTGLEHYSKGDSAKAVSCWRRALAVRPGDPETLRFLERASAVHRKL